MKKRSSKSYEFHNWLSGKINHMAKPIETPAAKLLEYSKARGLRHRAKYADVIQQLAVDQGKADLSDPFTAARTKAHLNAGVAELPDYKVGFKKQTIPVEDATGQPIMSQEFPNQPLMKVVDVPHSIKRL